MERRTSYDEYLKSPHWKATRARYFASDQPQECICGETERLDLHHMTYERLGREELTDLTPLCRNCHQMIHVLVRRREIGLDGIGLADPIRAKRYAERQAAMEQRAKVEFSDTHRERILKSHLREVKRWSQLWIQEGKNPVPILDRCLSDMRAAR